MSQAHFSIFNASAGSGKTYALTKSYIKLLLDTSNSQLFRHLLAITFTNKAVGEMKSRVIEMLTQFSNYNTSHKENSMLCDISSDLNMSKVLVSEKSTSVLQIIMHNYGGFEVSTIDGFTHKVIRTFARDLKLPVNFEVELDEKLLLFEAVDALIAKAGSDKYLTKTLIDFASEKTDEDKSWDISYDFREMAKLLLDENHAKHIRRFENKTLLDFNILKTQIVTKISDTKAYVVSKAKDTLAYIEASGLLFEDFKGKWLPNHFLKLSQGQLSVSFDSVWQTHLVEGQTLYPKKVSDHIARVIDTIQEYLVDKFTDTKEKIYELKLLKAIYINITPLSVLNAITKELETIKREQNKILISEFNIIVYNEIKDQPTPFLYERLGEKFKHYFVDEFQDTSRIQWQNLIPLMDNTMSESGSVMLVGDAKQSIYRWRGGDPEQFMDLCNLKVNPFQAEVEISTLKTNYRSLKAIVNFNNSFFGFLGGTFFTDSIYGDLYKDAKQNFYLEDEGYVSLEFLDVDKEQLSENYNNSVLKTINKCLEKRYTFSDICVITRKRKEGVAIAEYLTEHNIRITSSEALLLKNSLKVKFLNSFLNLLLDPDNNQIKLEVLSFIAHQNTIENKHLFFKTHLRTEIELFLESLGTEGYDLDHTLMLNMSIYELVEYLIREFHLDNTSDAFLLFYLNVVFEYTQKHNPSIRGFLSYFDDKKENLSVKLSSTSEAIQIMTIHKSKGLEFPVVIFPYADLDIYKEIQPKVWFPLEAQEFSGFSEALINFNKDVEHYSALGKRIYDIRKSQLQLDNINLLYVVLTRASEQLHIISKKDNEKEQAQLKTFSSLFIAYLKEQNIWLDNTLFYEFGELKLKEKNTEIKQLNPVSLISSSRLDHKLNIITKSGMLWNTYQEKALEYGNLIHDVLSKIKTIHDIHPVIEALKIEGVIANEDEESLYNKLIEITQNIQLKDYFVTSDNVVTEQDIISVSGKILRPDRININTNKEAVIIDYKTGERQQHHVYQLLEYETVLLQMNYKVTKKLLVYINNTVEIEEI